jgi:hypothetical protein
LADPLASVDVRDPLGPPRLPIEKSQTTLSEMAAEEMLGRRPKRRGRGAVWASIGFVGVAGVTAVALAYLRPDLNPLGRPAPITAAAPVVPAPAVPTRAVTAPSESAPVARTVQVQISDAPPHLAATVDGRPASLPLVLPAGPGAHSVVFHAPGYGDRNIVVDGSADRRLTLGMVPLPTAEPRQPDTDRSVPDRPSRAAASGGSAASRRHRRTEPTTAPPLDLDDDERKL